MKKNNESGMALIATILLLALVGAMLVGFVEVITSEQRAGGSSRDQTEAPLRVFRSK
jgi:type II secretory pathway component PulK